MDAKTIKRHCSYFERHLVYFPDKYEAYDSSHTSLVYFCCLGLSLLDQKLDPELEQWVWERYTMGGFRGSLTHKEGDYNFASTYFCLGILAMLGVKDPIDEAKRDGIKQAALNCQLPNGSFVSSSYNGKHSGEPSLRHMYSVLGSLHLLGLEVDKSKAVEYLLSCQNYDGGFGEFPGSESHAGLTYCAVVVLVKFCGVDVPSKAKLVNYLGHCQQANGGFNGRPNKPTDTCYSFWVAGTLKTLGVDILDNQKGCEFLFTQQHAIGGLVKKEGQFPDPLHSALGLAALSIFSGPVAKLDASLCLPEHAAQTVATWT